MTIQIDALPDPPSRSEPSTFSEKTDDFLSALPNFVSQANALAVEVNALAAAAGYPNAAALLTAILGMDGAGSGIDADLLDGQHGSYYAKNNSTASGTSGLDFNNFNTGGLYYGNFSTNLPPGFAGGWGQLRVTYIDANTAIQEFFVWADPVQVYVRAKASGTWEDWGTVYHSDMETGWITATLLNSWVVYTAGDYMQYRKLADGTVMATGRIKSGTTTAGTSLFNLPAGYRPGKSFWFPVHVSGAAPGSGYSSTVKVETDGDVIIKEQFTANTDVGISFSFKAEA